MRLPIFQLTWEMSLTKVGLIFPSEAKSPIHSFIFAIPIIIDFQLDKKIPSQVGEQLQSNNYYFPAEIEGSYREPEGVYRSSTFHFSFDNLASFAFFINSPRIPQSQLEFYRSNYIYRGTYGGLENFLFLPLIPADIGLLNSFFWSSNGLFVGFTPEFDESGFIENLTR